MTAEREYKYLVAEAFPDPARLRERYRAEGLELQPCGVREQRDVYFDTPDLTLLRAGVALRQRRFGEQVVATFKNSGTVRDGLHTRDEIEVPYIDRWPAEITERLGPLALAEKLGQLAELSARRERFSITKDGEAQAELTFDEVTGSDVTGRKVVRFREIELELFPTTENDLTNLTTPLALPGLTPHGGDKLSHTLKLFGQL